MLKRKRDPTFTTNEKEALLELVKTHFSVVESKKTDAVSMRQKTEEWCKIATEFNAVSGIFSRDWKVLKNCWENLKKKAKIEQTMRNQHFLGTGGGPPKKWIEDPILDKVLELIQARVSGFVNCFDSDGTHILAFDNSAQHENDHTKDSSQANQLLFKSGFDNVAHDNDITKDTSEVDQLLFSSDIEVCESQLQVELKKPIATKSSDITTTYTMDWSQYTPSMLRKKKNPALMKSPSPDVQQQQPSDSQECHAHTPQAPKPSVAAIPSTTSRRRPNCKETSKTPDILKERIKIILKADAHAEEEHELKVKILRLQEEKEKEILLQERIKTKQEEIKLQILELQQKKLKD